MIVFQNVTKHFGTDFAVTELDFSIQPGELVVITGPSGSGKTTLMRLLTREYRPNSGEIIFDDLPLTKLSSGKVHLHRRKIGVVFQDYKLLAELNVWENIALALSIIGTTQAEIERRVTDLLELVGLTEKAFLFPNQLSGGEAQRVSIARALSTAPKVIFADEPTGNLDPQNAQSVIKLLKKINDLGTTVLITTHNPEVKTWLDTDREMHLEGGKIVSDTGANRRQTREESDQTAQPPQADDESEEVKALATESKDKKAPPTKTRQKDHSSKQSRGWSLFGFGKKKESESSDEVKKPASEATKSDNQKHPANAEKPSKKSKTANSHHSQQPDDETITVEIESL